MDAAGKTGTTLRRPGLSLGVCTAGLGGKVPGQRITRQGQGAARTRYRREDGG